jgi:ribosome maturation factor RimP
MSLSTFKTDLEQDLISKVEPVVASLNYMLRDLEVLGRGSPTIRITLDKSGEHVGIDDCEKVHQKLSPMFDLWDPVPGHYTLELSSPGEHAPLRLLTHFEEALGGTIQFETTEALPLPAPFKPRKRWEGKLEKLDTEKAELTLSDSMGTHTVPFALIRSALWIRDWDPKSQAKDKKKGK